MKPLLALAALAAAVVLLRRRTETIYQSITPDADDSEVVGMPTTWGAIPDRVTLTGYFGTDGTLGTQTFGPGWYVEFAPTSRN